MDTTEKESFMNIYIFDVILCCVVVFFFVCFLKTTWLSDFFFWKQLFCLLLLAVGQKLFNKHISYKYLWYQKLYSGMMLESVFRICWIQNARQLLCLPNRNTREKNNRLKQSYCMLVFKYLLPNPLFEGLFNG